MGARRDGEETTLERQEVAATGLRFDRGAYAARVSSSPMPGVSRPTLRDRFDVAPAPGCAGPPRTHHRDLYLASDGSYDFAGNGGGIGIEIQGADGERLGRIARSADVPDNVHAEYLAAITGLEAISGSITDGDGIGLLVDQLTLAEDLNRYAAFVNDPRRHDPVEARVPATLLDDWRGLRPMLDRAGDLRVVHVPGGSNPAHELARHSTRFESLPDVAPGPQLPSLRGDVGRGVPADD